MSGCYGKGDGSYNGSDHHGNGGNNDYYGNSGNGYNVCVMNKNLMTMIMITKKPNKQILVIPIPPKPYILLEKDAGESL